MKTIFELENTSKKNAATRAIEDVRLAHADTIASHKVVAILDA